MRRRIPSFKALVAFEATARLKSVTAASEELFVTPGAVSRQITQLEEWIEKSLMQRSPQGIELTERGKKLAVSLGNAFEDVYAAIREAERPDESNIVTINVFPTFAISWLMPRLAEFHATCPGIDLRIKTSVQPPNFKNNDIDLAVFASVDNPPGLSGIPLFERVFLPVCSPELLERYSGESSLEILKNERLLMSDIHVGLWEKWLVMMGLSTEKLHKGVRFENSSLAWQAARKGAGFAMGQEALLQTDFMDGRLVAPFSESILDERLYRLLWRKEEENLSIISTVISWFKKEVS